MGMKSNEAHNHGDVYAKRMLEESIEFVREDKINRAKEIAEEKERCDAERSERLRQKKENSRLKQIVNVREDSDKD